MQLAELLQQQFNKIESGINPIEKVKRKDLIKELYEVYRLENKFENYYRYLHFLKKNKKQKNNETIEEFKKAKLPANLKYIKPFTDSFFAIKLSHIKTNQLYEVISIEKDIIRRKGTKRSSFTKWLFGAIK